MPASRSQQGSPAAADAVSLDARCGASREQRDRSHLFARVERAMTSIVETLTRTGTVRSTGLGVSLRSCGTLQDARHESYQLTDEHKCLLFSWAESASGSSGRRWQNPTRERLARRDRARLPRPMLRVAYLKAATRAACSRITRALSRSGVPATSPRTLTNGLDHTGTRGQPPQLSL